MFGPQHLKHLVAYFEGVDSTLAARMLRKHPPDEPALTNELCALFDEETQRIERRPAYGVDQLNTDLAAVGDGLNVEVRIDTYPHNSAMERYVSQSDFGFVLEYQNHVLPEDSWSAAYLVQAKRVFRNPKDGTYGEGSHFAAVNTAQHSRLERLAGILGRNALRYCLYCPPTPTLSDVLRTQVRALHTRNLAGEIFDFGIGLALRDLLNERGGIDAGIWFTDIHTEPKRLIDLHAQAFHSALPLTWFFLEHFNHGRLRSPWELAHGNDKIDPRVRDIVTGEPNAVRDIIAELSATGEDSEAPGSITVLPRHSITIKVTVGKELPPDLARAQRG